jgi:Xaa-Pro aminopeptidase
MPLESAVHRISSRLSRVAKLPLLARVSEPSTQTVTEEDAQGFLRSQKLAYECAVAIGRELQPGWTERRTAELMDIFLRDHGVKTFFHHSFAWFGDRASFQGFRHYWDFMPSSTRRLEEGQVIILDTAPVVEGYAGDIGFAFAKEPHAELKQARDHLLNMRGELLELFSSTDSPKEIWSKIDQRIHDLGFQNCHEKYPLGALGHRLHRVPLANLPGIGIPFTLHAYWSLLSRGLFPEVLGPWHEGQKEGLWAIEPHFGNESFGIKFEEILVVKNGKATWLQDDPPHVKLPEGFH